MSLRTTLWLLFSVVLLGGLLLWKQNDVVGPTEPKAPPTLLENYGADFRVEKFELLHARSMEQSTFELRGGDWWITDPLVDRAAPDNVQQLIEVMTANPREALDGNPDRAQLAELALEPPKGRVSLFGADGRMLRVRVGDRDPSGAYCYVMIEGDPALYRTGANLLNVIERPRQEWRDRRLLLGDGALARRLEISRPGEPKIVLEKSGVDWLMLEPMQFPANDSLAQQLVHGMLRLQVRWFVIADPTAEDLVEHRLDDAGATVVRIDAGAGPVEVRFGLPVGDDADSPRSAIDSVRHHLFQVEGEVLRLLALKEKDLRDPVVARAALTSARRIRLQTGSGAVAFDMAFDDAKRAFQLTEPFTHAIDDTRNGRLRYWFLDLKELKALPGDAGFLDRAELGGQSMDAVFDPPYAILELDAVNSAQVATRIRLEFAEPSGDTTLVRRADRFADLAYVVPTAAVDKVIGLDARVFLTRKVFPDDKNEMERFTVTCGGRTATIVRKQGAGDNARHWYDPDDTTRYSGDLQAYLFKAVGVEATSFLARDPQPADGFEEPSGTWEIEMRSANYYGGRFTLELGSVTDEGKTLLARSSELGPRVIFRLPVEVLDELKALFEDS